MKIAVATDDGTRVAAHTGRCRGFLLYEVRDGKATRLEHRANPNVAHQCGPSSAHQHQGSEHGQHSHEPLLQCLADCEALVTRGLGPRLRADLAAHNVAVYVCRDEVADEAARLLAEGRLTPADEQGTCCHFS